MGSVIDATGVAEYGLLIDGRWRRAAGCFERHNPARPAEVVGRSAAAAPEHVEDAFAAATAAAAGWARLPATRRGEILGQAADLVLARESEMAATLTFEVGKAIRDARGEVRRSAAILRYFAGECLQPLGAVYPSATPGTLLHSVREPLGVVCAITPWNFPLAIPAWKLAPALAFGNTVVWKPAEIASGSAALLAIALTEAGLPPGVLNLITGPAASIGDAVIGHPAAAAITFTGSNAVGRRIAVQAAGRGAKFQLELGGKNPVVVLPDADLERAVECTVRGAMLSTGQRCTATSRAIVVGDRHDEFVERLSAAAEGLVVGDPFDEATDVGPLASAAQHQTVRSYLEIARRAGHRLACGGGATDPEDGYYIDPTVYLDVDPGSRIAREEIFGPVLAVMRARDLEAALAIANASEYGLSASVFTRDLGAALTFAQRMQAGVVHVNGETAGAEPQVPFGGMKASSSHSREQGKAALEFFTDVKTVYLEAA